MASFREKSNSGSADRPSLSAGDDRSLLGQFQMRYPTGSLTAELLQIHQDNFLVRAVVQVAGVTMATGLAAADILEVAEDRARRRALAVLGLHPPGFDTIALSPLSTTAIPSHREFLTELGPVDQAFSTPTYPPLVDYGDHSSPAQRESYTEIDTALSLGSPSSVSNNLLEYSSVNQPLNQFDVPVYDEPLPDESIPDEPIYDEPIYEEYVPDEYIPDEVEEPVEEPTIEPIAEPVVPEVLPPPTPASPTKSKRSKTAASQSDVVAPDPQPPAAKAPIDLSDAIAQTTVEIKRLKWTEVQGRSYLQRTYGKRSRQHLSDEELFEFLEYLQQQPSPNES